MDNTKSAGVLRCGRSFLVASNRWLAICALFVAAVGLFAAPAAARDEPKTARQIGRFIQVALPITDQTAKYVRQVVGRAIERAKKENARLTLVFEFRAEGAEGCRPGERFQPVL